MFTLRVPYKLLALVITIVLIGTAIPLSIAKGATASITLKPTADAVVNASSPTANFGSVANLNIDGSPVIRSYLRFNVSGLNGATVTGAKLRFYVTDDSHSGFTISKVSNNTWTENGITYNNAPAVGSALRDTGAYGVGLWLDEDITGAVSGEGSYNFALNTTIDTTTAIASREAGANAPQLVLTLNTVSPTATTAPTNAPTNAPTKAPTTAPTLAPTTAPTKAPTTVPVNSTQTLNPAADAVVNASSPTTNFGSVANLNIDGSPAIRSYLRFNVSGLNGATVTGAKLRFYVTDDSHSGFTISKVSDNTWTESGITYNNAPAVGSALRDTGPYGVGLWLDEDITGAVSGEGSYNFVLNTAIVTTTAVASREAGANAPQLVLSLSSGAPTAAPTNAPTAAPTNAPTAVPTKAPTTAPTNAPTAVPTKAPTAIPTTAPTAVPTQPVGTVPYNLPGSWNLKFADDFNGSALDTSKWTPNWLGGSNTITKPINSLELSCYDPKQVSEAGGSLVLSAVARPCTASNGTTYNYASGMVTSSGHYTYTYGYMEALVWIDGTSGIKNWPAVWADGTGSWPTTGEIDVFEGLSNVAAWHYHWGSSSSPQQIGGSPSMSSQTGWHIFGADWEPGFIKYYYDGVLVGTVTQGVVNNPMYVILNYGISTSIAGSVQVPSTFLVNYVRVWQH